MEQLKEKPPAHTADRMLRRYGREAALDFARQYAIDAEHNARVEVYWNIVAELLEPPRFPVPCLYSLFAADVHFWSWSESQVVQAYSYVAKLQARLAIEPGVGITLVAFPV